MNAEEFFNNGFGADVEKVHRNHAIELMTNFAKVYHKEQLRIGGVMQWVAIEDKLPKEDGDYLINWDGIVIEAGYYVDKNFWHDYTVTKYENVTHWMCLPKPPCA